MHIKLLPKKITLHLIENYFKTDIMAREKRKKTAGVTITHIPTKLNLHQFVSSRFSVFQFLRGQTDRQTHRRTYTLTDKMKTILLRSSQPRG